MTTHKSIFYQAQEQVCEALNEDEVLSGKVTFISENSKDIDYELKNALGRQGIVGIVMTPDASYQGVTSEGEQVWDLKNFTVQVVENPIVNRGQPKYANITALDAAARATEILADPRFGLFGQYCPVTIEQGEDSGLIVAQAKFDVQIKAEKDVVDSKTKVTYQNGDIVKYDINGQLARGQISSLTSIVSLDIGLGVTSLATNAFYSCINLSSVTIPDSVTSIGGAVFMNCSKLTSVIIPDSVSSIDDSTFYGCTRLLDASLGNGLSSVPNGIFDGCTSLSSVILPQNAVSIDEGAFAKCTSLRSIDIPDSVASLNNGAFQRCSSLVDVHMPSSLTAIYEYAFDRCSSLSSVVIPEGVTHIGADAFIGCTATTDVYCYPNPANLTWDEADKDDFKTDGSTVCHVKSGTLAAYQAKFGNTVNVTFVGDL